MYHADGNMRLLTDDMPADHHFLALSLSRVEQCAGAGTTLFHCPPYCAVLQLLEINVSATVLTHAHVHCRR